jgi:hypothetical protein
LAETFIISSSRLTALPAGRVSNPARLLTSKVEGALEAAMVAPAVVRIMASDPIVPADRPAGLNFGSTRSRGLKFGVSELETFSASTFWRS